MILYNALPWADAKIHIEMQRIRIVERSKKNKVEGLTVLDSKTCYNAVVIKTMCHLCKDR